MYLLPVWHSQISGASRWILFTVIIVDARNHEPEICGWSCLRKPKLYKRVVQPYNKKNGRGNTEQSEGSITTL
jgi:hypothetical protein